MLIESSGRDGALDYNLMHSKACHLLEMMERLDQGHTVSEDFVYQTAVEMARHFLRYQGWRGIQYG